MRNRQYILAVDDNVMNRTIITQILETEYSVLEAENGKEALRIINEHATEISAVMLDLIMPIMDGYTFLQEVNKDERFLNIPIIVTTGNNDEASEIKALKLGAWDFVPKPYNADILKFRLKNAIDRSQLSAFYQLQYLAAYDTLTNIYNKTKFFEATQQMLADYNKTFVFVRFDIDGFQMINSFLGTKVGDELLQFIAKLVRDIAQSFEVYTYGRIESDIFCFCVPYKKVQILNFLQSVRKSLSSYNENYDIVPSFGLYVIHRENASIESIYHKASLAAKKSKGNYLNCYTFYDEEMSRRLKAEQKITNEMNFALLSGQFEVYIQPKYSVSMNSYTGGEALVRWNHPEKGLIMPGEFIPVFERSGFITQLDYYVWESVCRYLRGWLDEGKNPHPISVNVSRVNLYNPRLIEVVTELLKQYEIPPRLFNLELTESAYTDNPAVMINMMSQFQEYGFTIMMDDFGSGYSSLNILKDIKVDILKIDMRFLSKSKIEGRGENIIASVIRMAKWLNIPTIAEGVETKKQVDFLHSIGCEYIQGYYFSKPIPVSEYEELMTLDESIQQKKAEHEPDFNTDAFWVFNSDLEELFNDEKQAVAMYEFDGTHIELLRVNNAFYEFLGYDDEAYRSRQPLQLVAPEDRDAVLEAFREVSQTHGEAECKYMRNRVGKTELCVALKLKYMHQIGGKHIIFSVIRDAHGRETVEQCCKKQTIMIVDDVEINRVILRGIFSKDYHLLEAVDGEAAVKLLYTKSNTIDVILLSLMIPVISGEELLKYKKEIPELDGIPVIIITPDNSPRQQINTLSLGANDYIVKPFVAETVRSRVKSVMESNTRFQKVLQEYAVISKKVQMDQMTGVYNRKTAENMIEHILKNPSGTHAMVILDVDDFKGVNDHNGHLMGDNVLRAIAQQMKSLFFRKSDIVARMGGDEFGVFVTDITSPQAVVEACQKLCDEIRLLQFYQFPVVVSCSIGIAVSSETINTFELLYRNADSALYESKCQGKNQIALYEPDKET